MESNPDFQKWQQAIQGIENAKRELSFNEFSAFITLVEFYQNGNFEVSESGSQIQTLKNSTTKNRLLKKVHLPNFIALCEKYFKMKPVTFQSPVPVISPPIIVPPKIKPPVEETVTPEPQIEPPVVTPPTFVPPTVQEEVKNTPEPQVRTYITPQQRSTGRVNAPPMNQEKRKSKKGMKFLIVIIILLIGGSGGVLLSILIDQKKNLPDDKECQISAATFVSDIKTIGLTNKNRETERAMIINKLKTCFTVHETLLSSSYERTFYLVITQPDLKVIPNNTNDSFPTKEGDDIVYTYKSTIAFDNRDFKACIFTVNIGRLIAGNYEAKLYCEGDLVGASTFVLK